MSNTESTKAHLESEALALVRSKDEVAKALKGTLGYHKAREKAIVSEAVLRAMCDNVGVDFNELISKYE